MQAEIITIGDELLIGQVVDTNSAWMATQLNEWGIELKQITSVHDDAEHIKTAITEALTRADLILLTGGLGPTKDDITKKTLCEFFHTELVYSEEINKHLHELYKERPDVLNRLTDTQCLVPKDCTILANKVGSAQVMAFRQNGKTIISMPGVPYEMKWAMTNSVKPFLEAQNNDKQKENIVHRTAQVFGIPESTLAIKIEDWENALPKNIHLAYLPKDGIVRLRLSGYDVEDKIVDEQVATLCEILGDAIIAKEDKSLEVLVADVLKKNGQTIASAESCTGGKIAQLLNKWPGSSAFYKGSVIAYSNEVKENILGVRHDTLLSVGAVSEETVRQMAEGVKKLLNVDYAIATSGIAGPDGGSEEKPVGTVWIAIATPKETWAECFHLGKLREQVTDRTVVRAFVNLLKLMNK